MDQIRWSRDSIDSLKEICDFIAKDSKFYAKNFRDQVFDIVEHLSLFPEMGRIVPESEDPLLKEIIYKGYRIIYQRKEEYLEILLIIHGSRLLDLG